MRLSVRGRRRGGFFPSGTMLLAVGLFGLACSGNPNATRVSVSPAPSAETTPREYSVRLQRPRHIGQRGRLVVDDEDLQTNILHFTDSPPHRDEPSRQIHFEAIEEVQALDEWGEPLQLDYTVTSFVVREQQQVERPLQTGQRIHLTRARRAQDAVVLVDGQPASQRVRNFLSSVLHLDVGNAFGDGVFGTPHRQHLGAHWPIDRSRAFQVLQKLGMEAPEENITGQVRLVDVTRIGSVECLDVQANLRLENYRLTTAPPHTNQLRSLLVVQTRWLLPVDERLPALQVTVKLDSENVFEVHPPGEDPAIAETRSHHQSQTTYTPL